MQVKLVSYTNVANVCREFVACVRCIRILSPCEVKQMGEEGMQILNSAGMQQGGSNGLMLEVGCGKDGL